MTAEYVGLQVKEQKSASKFLYVRICKIFQYPCKNTNFQVKLSPPIFEYNFQVVCKKTFESSKSSKQNMRSG